MDKYDSSQIQILEGLKAVRKVPGMYIGSTGTEGLHHMVYEVVDNCIDESMAGFASNINIVIYRDGSISVEDDGRGIPVDIHPKYNRPGLEIVMTELHSGAKFDKKVYKVTGGLHGVGVHVVNALSEYLIALVKKDGKIYYERFERGIPVSGLVTLTSDEAKNDENIKDIVIKYPEHGTIIKFYPDKEIFDSTDFSYSVISERIMDLAFLNPKITINLSDFRTNKSESFHFDGGLVEYVQYLNQGKEVINKDPIHCYEEYKDYTVEFAMQYNNDVPEISESFVNNIKTPEGGTHLTGFHTGVSRAIIDYAKNKNLIKGVSAITGDDTREGLVSVLHVKMYNPQFEGQTKEKLGNSAVKNIVSSITEKYLKEYFESFPLVAEAIIRRVLAASAAREASRKAKDLVRRKTALESGSLPGKLADCSSDDSKITEIYIVEGDSAGGSAKQARNREFQAILPLRGKILNVEKANDNKALENEEIKNLITAIGTNIKDKFDIRNLRYNKIIIMTDADVDGAHIRTLLLTFFYRFMKDLIDQGHVYFAQPPLYRIQKGNDIHYVFFEDEKDDLIKKLGGNVIIQRFKGLGEMNPEQLWDTTMNPETRKLVQVTIEDAYYADQLFSILMGEKVEPRRKFIEENAKYVKNLDI
ncbi:DNA topoisomerase (ATP-hydrolyzing) subunit B [Acidiplasma sp.]|uniref:DNA topoisomerase (ATP-hydrolyzing) subunit B n=1 Tax=Acidiplasma sp. TaxID=1872114 RepID=UPI00258E4497|nr:DNA topoisomerase (ATP-hydrolyzing) subunit B [Acidiplasma sp.]